jgi:hypothetical protein
MATNRVLTGQTAAFPLTYHWRVLPGAARPFVTDREAAWLAEHLRGAPAIRTRPHELTRVTASLVLFQEYIPTRPCAG